MTSHSLYEARPSVLATAGLIVILAMVFNPSPLHATIHMVAAATILLTLVVFAASRSGVRAFWEAERGLIVFTLGINIPMTLELWLHGAKNCLPT